MTEIKDAKLLQILPGSISNDRNIRACAEALDGKLKEVSANVDLPSIYMNLDGLDSGQLDHMAVAWDASVWRQSWTVEMKRIVLRNVILEKRKRGTLGAVKAAIETIGSFSEIKEWWQESPKGAPHTFTVTARLKKFDGVLEKELQEDLFALIDDAKPVRSHYRFILNTEYSGSIGISGIYRRLSYARVRGGIVNSEQDSRSVAVVSGARPVILCNVLGVAK